MSRRLATSVRCSPNKRVQMKWSRLRSWSMSSIRLRYRTPTRSVACRSNTIMSLSASIAVCRSPGLLMGNMPHKDLHRCRLMSKNRPPWLKTASLIPWKSKRRQATRRRRRLWVSYAPHCMKRGSALLPMGRKKGAILTPRGCSSRLSPNRSLTWNHQANLKFPTTQNLRIQKWYRSGIRQQVCHIRAATTPSAHTTKSKT